MSLFIYNSLLAADSFADFESLLVLKEALSTGELIFQGFENVWQQVILNTSSPIWVAIMRFAADIALLVLIYLALKQGSEVIQKRDWHGLVLLIVWPTIVALLIGNNGFLISQGIGALRTIDREFVKAMSTTQIASTNIQNALQDIQLTNAAREQIDSLINQCNSFNGTEYSDCLNNTIPQIDQIVEEAEAQNNGALAVLENYKDKIKGAILNIAAVGQIILAPQKIVLTTLVHALLIAVQLAFNMIIEIALLLHSLLAPIAVILTLIPTGQRYISIWLTWFAAIAAIQVCYTIIIGLAATAIVLSNAQLFSDVTFLVLAAFFGPGLAYAMSKGGGVALYQSINSSVDKTISFGTEVVSKAVLLVL
ncbi:MAG: hypothetical protein WBM86_09245 [Waterburya sp.]